MAITRFQDLPSENSPINSENLNGNFDELGVKVGTSVDNNYRVNVLHSKNLLNYTIPSTTNWGVTTSMSDGKLILDGTTTGVGDIYNNPKNALLLKAGTYTISATKISGTYQKNNKDTAIYIGKAGDKTILFNLTSSNDYSGTRTIKLTEDTLIYLNIYTNGSGMVLTNLVVGLQIERGSTATDFEIPVTPSINVDGETIYTKGQNEVYSTAEQRIGTWIDGKPIYRQVIQGTTASSNLSTAIGSISNLGTIVNIRGYIVSASASQSIPINFVYNTEQNAGYREHNNILIRTNSSDYQSKPCYVIVEYTKTTD